MGITDALSPSITLAVSPAPCWGALQPEDAPEAVSAFLCHCVVCSSPSSPVAANKVAIMLPSIPPLQELPCAHWHIVTINSPALVQRQQGGQRGNLLTGRVMMK